MSYINQQTETLELTPKDRTDIYIMKNLVNKRVQVDGETFQVLPYTPAKHSYEFMRSDEYRAQKAGVPVEELKPYRRTFSRRIRVKHGDKLVSYTVPQVMWAFYTGAMQTSKEFIIALDFDKSNWLPENTACVPRYVYIRYQRWLKYNEIEPSKQTFYDFLNSPDSPVTNDEWELYFLTHYINQ